MKNVKGNVWDTKLRNYLSKAIETKILKNPTLLSHHYIPDRLIARDDETLKVMDLFATMVKFSCDATNAVIIGKPGCGKSVVVRFVLKMVDEMLQNQRSDLRVLPVYIQCRHNQTQQRILQEILKTLAPNTDIPKRGIPLSDYVDEIFRVMTATRTSIILVLDEIDRMKGDTVLYMFSRPREHGLRDDQLYTSIIGITNNPEYHDELEPSLKSSLLAEEIVFHPYSKTDLEEILTARQEAFYEEKLDEIVIPLCAALSAKEHGDARRAIDLLRKAGQIAERQGAELVTEAHVREALEAIEVDSTYEVIKGLPWHSQAVLYSFLLIKDVMLSQYVRIGDLYSIYCEYCLWSRRNEPLTMRRVSDLLDEHEMLGVVGVRIASRGRYGRTKEISTTLKVEQMLAILNPLMDPDKEMNMRQFYLRVFRDRIPGQKTISPKKE
ncbi:MAG: AAA family ATPase [Methanoculleus horonobensis]|jgi:cell division control protein 6|nr:AAA family ATPase [Methanoculleus horonobensis]